MILPAAANRMSRVVDQRKKGSLIYGKKLIVRSVVGCGGQHDVLIVSIFLHLFEKSRVEFFVMSRW